VVYNFGRVARVSAEVGSAANNYEILAKLATGGMAEIFLARGLSTAGVERYVVLKRILRHRAHDESFIAMFLDEARLAAQLQHPNIAQVYDVGKLGDSYFFTMEYVHGETVRTLLQRSQSTRRPIPIATVLAIIAGSAAGLHHAHERKGMDGRPLGIVHRDVSPSNLMISYEGTVKVVDFGVAKAEHRESETRSGTVKGKISYMSPEQCKGLDIDRRSDLFSLGIVVWEMLTTEKLFRRNSDFENMQAIVSENVTPPSQLRPDVPPGLDAIVARLLAKNPADRYQTADEVHEEIETLAAQIGATLSASSLGRYMRDLFGQRPEPWIELQASERNTDAQTVTGESLSSAAAYEELDRQLSQVPELNRTPTSVQPPPVAMPTIPLRVQADVMPLPLPRAPTMPPVLPPTLAMPPALPMRPHTPSATPPSQPSHESYPQYPSAAGLSASHSMPSYAAPQLYTPPPPKRSRLMFIVAPALAVVVGVGFALLVRGGHDDRPAPAEPDRKVEMEQQAPAPVDAAVAAVDEVAAEVVVDAAVATVNPPDAATVADATPDAATAAIKPAPDDRQHRPRPPAPPPKPDLAALLKAGKADEVVSECAASSRTLAANATTCTLAACKADDASKAKKWLASVSAGRRASVQKQCGDVLPRPAPPQPPDPCKSGNFLDCQH
jgi:serine/threonine protein kinase